MRIEAQVGDAVSLVTVKLWNPEARRMTGVTVGQTMTARNVTVDRCNGTVTLSANEYNDIEVNDA